MASQSKIEVWLRGPIENVPPLLQPVAHALLQAREEVIELLAGFPNTHLWDKPVETASVGFHLQHITGVLDRLFTYADGNALNAEQLQYLSLEGKVDSSITSHQLVQSFKSQVDQAMDYLQATDEKTLLEVRYVGLAQIPSTKMGLLFHAAEHTMRHTGQLFVTVTLVKTLAKRKDL